MPFFYISRVTERIGTGLQHLLRWFESNRGVNFLLHTGSALHSFVVSGKSIHCDVYQQTFFYTRNARSLFLFFCLLTASFNIPTGANAQTKQTQHSEQVWIGYFNQTRFSDKWGLWADFHLRSKEDFVEDLSQGVARIGLTYYLKNDLRLTAGYAYFHHFPSENHKNVAQPEHRPWQQLQWQTNYPKLRLVQRLRMEERWRRKILNDDRLDDGYHFNYRIRYSFLAQVPLNKKYFQPGTLSFVANDEVLINFGKQVVNNYFDQNRVFIGFAYHVNTHDNFQFGYMNSFQQLAAGNSYRSIHVARLFYLHNLDLRKVKNNKIARSN
jgi:hypothetical protein